MESRLNIRISRVILIALVSGLALGVVARTWMRWITTEPEFTWSGTIFIILSFMVFMTNQSIVQLIRQRYRTKRSVQGVRIAGVIFSLPIFNAGGVLMLPAVIFACLGVWGTAFGKVTRSTFLLLSLIIPVKISIDIISDFGWSFATLGRISLFVAIYSVVIFTMRPTVTPFYNENSDGPHKM